MGDTADIRAIAITSFFRDVSVTRSGVRIIQLFIIMLFFTGCAATEKLKRGDELAKRGEWDEAVFNYGELAKDEPWNIEYKNKYLRARFEAAELHFKRGEDNLEKGNHEAAMLEFQAAILLDPTNEKARSSMKKAKRLMDSLYYYGKALEFLRDGKEKEARGALKKSVSLNPGNQAAQIELDKLKRQQKLVMDGYELDLKSAEPITLEFKDAGVKKAFEVLSKLSGINFVFDEDVKDSKTTILIKSATFQQTLDLILATNRLSKKAVNENTIIIYPSTPQKAAQYEELMIKVFYLSNSDAKKTVNLLRTMLKARDIHVQEDLNAIVLRARPDAIELAEKILNATDIADSEVMLAVEVLEVNRNKALKLGLDLSPDTVTAAVPTTNGVITLENLRNLSSGDLLLTLPSAILNIKKEDLDANTLANPRIRVKNNSKAKIHIGDRVPIITTTVNQGVSTENIQYQDVGLKLSVEPVVRQNDEIDLKVSLEVSSLGTKTVTSSGSVAYQIGTRNADTVLRLYDGETQIIGGLINEEERNTVAKVPFLGDIPIIGRLFASNDSSKVKTDILLSITPYIVRRLEVPEETAAGFLSGKDENPSVRGIFDGFRPELEQESGLKEPGMPIRPFDEPGMMPPPPPFPPRPMEPFAPGQPQLPEH